MIIPLGRNSMLQKLRLLSYERSVAISSLLFKMANRGEPMPFSLILSIKPKDFPIISSMDSFFLFRYKKYLQAFFL